MSNCSSPSTVSQAGNKNSNKFQPITNLERNFQQQKSKTNGNNNNRRGTFNTNRENHSYYPPSQIPSKPSKLIISFRKKNLFFFF